MDEEEIKEYHFHAYFYQNNPKSKEMAIALRTEFFRFVSEHLYVVALDKVRIKMMNVLLLIILRYMRGQ